MNKSDILLKLQSIFRDVLDQADLQINESSSPDTIEGWDSIVNVNIIMAVEEDFGVSFSVDELQTVKSVASIIELIQKKV